MSKPKQPRKELTSLRLEPQVKYLAEIASRVQRRSLTNYIEWAIEECLKQTPIRPNDQPVADLMLELWDVNEPERLIKLASIAPELLTYDEQLIFKILIDSKYNLLATGVEGVFLDSNTQTYHVAANNNGLYTEEPLALSYFNMEKISDFWESIKKASQGDRGEARKVVDGIPF